MNKYAIIHWKDIASISENNIAWFDKEQAIEFGREYFNYDYVTLGEVIEDNNDFLLVAGTIDNAGSRYSDISMILKSVITKIDYFNER